MRSPAETREHRSSLGLARWLPQNLAVADDDGVRRDVEALFAVGVSSKHCQRLLNGEPLDQSLGRFPGRRRLIDVGCLDGESQPGELQQLPSPGRARSKDYPTNGSSAFPRKKSLTRIEIEVITTVWVVARPTPSVPPRV